MRTAQGFMPGSDHLGSIAHIEAHRGLYRGPNIH